MRTDGPSLTAQGVARVRATLARPSTPTGDPEGDTRLSASLAGEPAAWASPSPRTGTLVSWVEARTRFFDAVVLGEVQGTPPVPQVVILGAGYDGRAMRFRSPGVQFFEVDHPATQADKRQRVRAVGAPNDDIRYLAADFTQPGLGDAIASAGHDASQRTLFVCEGVLRYLPEVWFRGLLSTAAERAAPGSLLAVSIATQEPNGDSVEDQRRAEHEKRLAELGEPVLTVPPKAVALRWVQEAGWLLHQLHDAGDSTPASGHGRLLLTARRA